MKLYKLTALILAVLCLLTGCIKNIDKTNTTEVNGDKLQVYASFYAMYDFARLIGGDRADIYTLCPVGTEPHDFEPKTSDIARLSHADVFIYNGMGMESWAEKTALSINSDKLIIVEAASDIPHVAEDYDPHVWLDPSNAIKEMENIKNAFCERDSENADYYIKNYEQCREKTDRIINDYKTAAVDFSDRNVITAHAAYGYLCNAFNLNQTPIEGIQGESDPSPARMAEIIDFIKDNNIKYIFAEELDSSKTVEAVAKETGTQILTLNPFEGDDSGDNYFTVMEQNLEALKKALN